MTKTNVLESIGRLSEHYRNNIDNRLIRKALLTVQLNQIDWTHVQNLAEKYKGEGYSDFNLEELYDEIISMCKFIQQVRIEIVPDLRNKLIRGESYITRSRAPLSRQDRVLRDMAIGNFPSNLKLLAFYTRSLLDAVKEYDEKVNGPVKAAYRKFEDLITILPILDYS